MITKVDYECPKCTSRKNKLNVNNGIRSCEECNYKSKSKYFLISAKD